MIVEYVRYSITEGGLRIVRGRMPAGGQGARGSHALRELRAVSPRGVSSADTDRQPAMSRIAQALFRSEKKPGAATAGTSLVSRGETDGGSLPPKPAAAAPAVRTLAR